MSSEAQPAGTRAHTGSQPSCQGPLLCALPRCARCALHCARPQTLSLHRLNQGDRGDRSDQGDQENAGLQQSRVRSGRDTPGAGKEGSRARGVVARGAGLRLGAVNSQVQLRTPPVDTRSRCESHPPPAQQPHRLPPRRPRITRLAALETCSTTPHSHCHLPNWHCHLPHWHCHLLRWVLVRCWGREARGGRWAARQLLGGSTKRCRRAEVRLHACEFAGVRLEVGQALARVEWQRGGMPVAQGRVRGEGGAARGLTRR